MDPKEYHDRFEEFSRLERLPLWALSLVLKRGGYDRLDVDAPKQPIERALECAIVLLGSADASHNPKLGYARDLLVSYIVDSLTYGKACPSLRIQVERQEQEREGIWDNPEDARAWLRKFPQ